MRSVVALLIALLPLQAVAAPDDEIDRNVLAQLERSPTPDSTSSKSQPGGKLLDGFQHFRLIRLDDVVAGVLHLQHLSVFNIALE
jgi:hypothetical protein